MERPISNVYNRIKKRKQAKLVNLHDSLSRQENHVMTIQLYVLTN